MNSILRHSARYCRRPLGSAGSSALASRTSYGRTAAYRRLLLSSELIRLPGGAFSGGKHLPLARQIHSSPRTLLSDRQRGAGNAGDEPREPAGAEAGRSRNGDAPFSSSETAQQTGSDDASARAERGSQQGEKEGGEGSEGKADGKDHADSQSGSEQGNGKKNAKPPPPPPPPPHGDKTPWQVFTDTLRAEFEASQEWKESTKALASSANQLAESESVRRARAAYEAASGAASSTTSQALRSTGRALGKGAAWTWDTPVVKGVRAGVSATGKALEKGTRPVRETQVYKKAVGEMREVIDDGSSSRYGGWTEKEERRRRREERELNEARASGRLGRRPEKVEPDPNAGTNITVHKDAAWKESWREFKDANPLMQSLFSLKAAVAQSEHPLLATTRRAGARLAALLWRENEMARVIKKFREMDPAFHVEPFLRELREYVLPEVLDAYVSGDADTLRAWLSAAQYQVWAALAQQYAAAGLRSAGRILDIRHVDILAARLLEPGDVPVFIVTCRTQEVHVYRSVETGELAAGTEDRVQLVTYAIGVTRVPEDVTNPETRGWRLIELQKSGRDYI